jgi:hypothetical protein
MQAQVPQFQSRFATRQYVVVCAPCTVRADTSPVKFFDKTENSASNARCYGDQVPDFGLQTGAITSNLNSNPTKTSGLAGVSLGASVSFSGVMTVIRLALNAFRRIVQSFVTLSTGFGVGLGFAWKIALLGIGVDFRSVQNLHRITSPYSVHAHGGFRRTCSSSKLSKLTL